MLVKAVGAAAVLVSSYILGLYFSKSGYFRQHDLEPLKKAATIFRAELLYSSSPLFEVFNQISIRTTGAVSMIFKEASESFEKRNGVSAEEIWANSIIKESGHAYFNSEDIENMFSFGRTLGFADKSQQADNAAILISYIESAQEEIREKRRTEERLYKALGLLGGIMVCVILF